MKIEDIQTWTTSRGIGCIVMSWQGQRLTTPHGLTFGSKTERRPSRICKRCRDALPHLEPAEPPEPEVVR